MALDALQQLLVGEEPQRGVDRADGDDVRGESLADLLLRGAQDGTTITREGSSPAGIARLSSSMMTASSASSLAYLSAEAWVSASRKPGRVTLEYQILSRLMMVSALLTPPRASGP